MSTYDNCINIIEDKKKINTFRINDKVGNF